MGQSLGEKVIPFRKQPEVTIETDAGLLELMKRAETEVFDSPAEFEQAYSEALAQQVLELSEANDGVFPDNLAEELADAMRAVLLQWLGEYKCYSEAEFPRFLRKAIGLE